MKTVFLLANTALAATYPVAGWTDDACSGLAIVTEADVSVSDGSRYRAESFFHSTNEVAIRFLDDNEQVIAVEGSLSWIRQGGVEQLGGDFHKLFALGHQYHALLRHFDEIATSVSNAEAVRFGEEDCSAISGSYPYGGTMHLIDSGNPLRPAGMLFEFPGAPTMEAHFFDWRGPQGSALPYHIQIDDGDRVFDYRYSDVDFTPRGPLWFLEAVSPPDIEQVQIHRQQRRQLAADCPVPPGDAGSLP